MLKRRTAGLMPSAIMLTIALGMAIQQTATGQAPAPAAPDPALVKRGMEVYTAQKCQICHSVAGKGNKKGPLDGVGTKLSADDIRQWIVKPTEMAAKTKSTVKPPMPDKYATLPAADIDALVAYMQSLK